MSYLYGGKILRVNLSRREARFVPTDRYASKYIGGRGTNARILYESVDVDTDPLGLENVVCFGTGPLSGTTFPGCSRTDVMCKSPVTNLIGNASVGGDWSAELKYAGWDHVVLEGKAEHPVYVDIHNDAVQIRDARALWGLTTYEAHEAIRNELGPDVKIIGIGPAGERMVTFATIHSNIGNSASRTGVGAVMGSKNVKAIAVRGTQGVGIADPKAFLEASLRAHNTIRASKYYEEFHTIGLTLYEKACILSGLEGGGDGHANVPPSFDERFDYYSMFEKHCYKRTGCTGCPVHCMEAYHVGGLGSTVMSCELYPQLSYEIRNADPYFHYWLVMTCQKMGIDSVSTATIFQWLMELWELGIIDSTITGGINLEWGNKDGVKELFLRIIGSDGIGAVVAKGMKETADYIDARVPLDRRYDKSSYWWAMQVNNNPMYGVNPRMHGMALAYAVGRRSDCIQDLDMVEVDIANFPVYPEMSEDEKKRLTDEEKALAERVSGKIGAGDLDGYQGKAEMTHDQGITTGLPDMMGTCKWHTKWLFMDIEPENYAEALSAGTGREVGVQELITASLRLRNVERVLECKMGRRRENDTIPEKEFGRPVARGFWKGKIGTDRKEFERMKDEYYALRGWDAKTGIPTVETLLQYGLDDMVEDLPGRGGFGERRPVSEGDDAKLPDLDGKKERDGGSRETKTATR
ncbi:MAG: hypothetical protein M1274_09110 [Actinobacteria bacterium]|nr:hypothetical protein [Actinomycetota bacterium]